MVWTKDFIYFSREGQSIAVDTIPLNEIIGVTAMNKKMQRRKTMSLISLNGGSTTEKELFKDSSKSQKDLDPSSVRKIQSDVNGSFDRLVQIKTMAEGFNSGRTYFLQAISDEQCYTIVQRLEKAVKDAVQRAAATSRFRASQATVKQFYCSMFFQGTIAFLIITVNLSNDLRIAQSS